VTAQAAVGTRGARGSSACGQPVTSPPLRPTPAAARSPSPPRPVAIDGSLQDRPRTAVPVDAGGSPDLVIVRLMRTASFSASACRGSAQTSTSSPRSSPGSCSPAWRPWSRAGSLRHDHLRGRCLHPRVPPEQGITEPVMGFPISALGRIVNATRSSKAGQLRDVRTRSSASIWAQSRARVSQQGCRRQGWSGRSAVTLSDHWEPLTPESDRQAGTEAGIHR